MKKIILALVLGIAGAGNVRAQVRAIDLDAPLRDARVGLSWQVDGTKLGVAYVPVISFNGPNSGQEYVTLNGGLSDKLESGKAGYIVSIGFRADTIFAWLAGGEFSKKYLRFAVLPPIQVCVGPITYDFHRFLPALTIAKKF